MLEAAEMEPAAFEAGAPEPEVLDEAAHGFPETVPAAWQEPAAPEPAALEPFAPEPIVPEPAAHLAPLGPFQQAAQPPADLDTQLPPIPKFTIQAQASPALRSWNPDPRAALDSLLGELSAGHVAAASLKVELPGDCAPQDIEVVVQIRQNGEVIAEGQLTHPVPAKGGAVRLNVDLNRS